MTRMSTRSPTPASSARLRASAACGSDSVMPVTDTPYSRAAWIARLPQPQPTSSIRSPFSSASFVHTRSSFAFCAASRLEPSREKNAQL